MRLSLRPNSTDAHGAAPSGSGSRPRRPSSYFFDVFTARGRLYAIAILGLAFLAGVGFGAESDDETGPSIEGAWRWAFTMPDGSVAHPKLTLVLEDGRLTGTTTYRPGLETAITNVVLQANRLRFQVVRLKDERPVVTTYSGTWMGTNLVGEIESNWAGPVQRFAWKAHRSHVGVEGIWTWANAFGPRGGRGRGRSGIEGRTRVKLEQEGEKVTGRTLGRGARRMPIMNGTITNNEVAFEIHRRFREVTSITKYQGKQTGDTIVGTVEFEMNGRTRKGRWEARRGD